MFDRILVANRGEIALRVIRACKELNISPVAIYSKEDADASYLRMVDASYCVGPAESAKSYLHIPNIISAAELADVDAIHPGYGFLAENDHFAEVCESCHIKFIGPSPDCIRQLGDKAAARQLAKKLGIPCVPGSEGPLENEQEAVKLAHQIGYPVLIKAVAGGGGRGMRVAHNDPSLHSNFNQARAEAGAAFGNPSVYLEKYVQRPRHVEFQILADNFGNVIHLGERDCSIQRRHQKLIEESPCPVMTPELRERMGNDAIRLMKAANYTNAGTVEFLLDQDFNYYFIEVNTRIQVEHPVTEMVTGIDLVKQQIKVAAGEKLELTQNDVQIIGSAIECRVNAEDPENDFKPSPGTVTHYFTPGGSGVRVDTHICTGYRVSPRYDSMLAKLIVRRRNRAEAIACMARALDEFQIEGVKTTIPLYKDIFTHQHYLESQVDTGWVESHYMRKHQK